MACAKNHSAPPFDELEGTESNSSEEDAEARPLYLNWLERLVSWTSAVLLLAAIGYLAWEGITGHEPPAFEIRTDQIWASREHYYLMLTVTNTGDKSVQELRIDVLLRRADSTAAQSMSHLSWLPAQSTRKSVVIFSRNPRQYNIVFEPRGYELP